jgi:hypothetical protein
VRLTLHPALFLAAILLLQGCASVSVSKREWNDHPVAVPKKILVKPFSLSRENFRVDREGDVLEEFEDRFLTEFADRLAERLNKYILPAEAVSSDTSIKETDVWIMEGHFHRVHQGSRALRALIGFGLGSSKVDTTVLISRVDGNGGILPVAHISTTGGSNSEPGAILGGPFGAGPRLILRAATSGLSADARRTARTITAVVSEKLASQGSPLAGRPLKAKPLGGLPDPD